MGRQRAVDKRTGPSPVRVGGLTETKRKNLRWDIMRWANAKAREENGAPVSLGVPELAERFNVSPEAVRSVLLNLITEEGRGYHRTSANLFVYRKVENRRKVPDRQLTVKVLRFLQSRGPDEWADVLTIAAAVDGDRPSVSDVCRRLARNPDTHIIKLGGSAIYVYRPPVSEPVTYEPPPEAQPVPIEDDTAATPEPQPAAEAAVEWAEPPEISRSSSGRPARSMRELDRAAGPELSDWHNAEDAAYDEPETDGGRLHWVRLPSGKLLAEDDHGNLYELRKL